MSFARWARRSLQEIAMKKTKAQPSLPGLLLVVTGMLLLSIVLLNLGNTTPNTPGPGRGTLGLAGVGLAALVTGAVLSARK